MSDFEKAKQRAHDRANVLNNLQKSFAKQKEQQAVAKQDAPLSQNASTSLATELILEVTGHSSLRSKQFFSDALNGKQIILDNTKSAADIIKNEVRAKIQNKRKKVVSNKELKRLGLCNPLTRPCNQDVQILHDLWWEYIKEVIKVCASEPQLQARLCSADMVGARAYVVNSTLSKLVGVRGIITATSANCFYLLIDTLPPHNNDALYILSDDNDDGDNNKEINQEALSNRKRRKLNRRNQINVSTQEAQTESMSGITGTTTDKSATTVTPQFTPRTNNRNHTRPILGSILRIVKDHCNLAIVLPASMRKLPSQGDLASTTTQSAAQSASAYAGFKTPNKSAQSNSGLVTPASSRATSRSGDGGSDDDDDDDEEDGDDDSSDSGESESPPSTDKVGDEGNNSIYRTNGSTLVGATSVTAALSGVDTCVTATVEPLIVFDHNEKHEGGRMLMLYGKYYMPHCKPPEDLAACANAGSKKRK